MPLPRWVSSLAHDAPLLSYLPLDNLKARLGYSRRLAKLWGLLEQNYGNPQLRLADAARSSGVSKDHLNCLIKDSSGLSFHKLLNMYRVGRAASLLQVNNYSITEVYLSCGFNSAATFLRQFRYWTGRRPLDFKRNVKLLARTAVVQEVGVDLKN